jgi:DNA-binding NtrC family response regulator
MFVVLVVQDDGTPEDLSDALRDDGLEVTSVATNEEAVAALERRPFDVVVSDGSSTHLLAHIQEHHLDVAVILLGADSAPDSAVDALRRGAYDVLERPIHLERLVTLVNRAGVRQGLLRENRELRRQLRRQEEGLALPLGRRLEEVERRYIVRTLEILGNNKARAAKVLGISKKTLYRRLHEYGIPLGAGGAATDKAEAS